ncbi:MAG: heme ABC transporter ATP-binding protein [Alphaproteobacteria bacterium]|nr:heme ABC transporter ATP-binding protein [Alphaproteobacteria bacterium]
MIEAMNISVARGGRNLVEGASIRVAAGEFVALVGPNGAGKSTLLRALAGEVACGQGEVRLRGRDVRICAPDWLARNRAMMAQETALAFEMTVRDVVRLGRLPHERACTRAENDAAAGRAMALAGIEAFADRSLSSLSGGERQRVHLARTLAQIGGVAAPLLLLDEPTASLDLAHQREVLGLARRIAAAGAAVVAVVHDLFAATRHCGRIVVMDRGRIVRDGAAQAALDARTLETVFAAHGEWVALSGGGSALLAH